MSRSMADAVKHIALNAVESSSPCDIRYGTVVGVNPLRVQITPTFTIGEEVLMIPERLSDREIKLTDFSGTLGEVTWYIYGGLDLGDSVAMIKESGGGKYYILDRYRPSQTYEGHDYLE